MKTVSQSLLELTGMLILYIDGHRWRVLNFSTIIVFNPFKDLKKLVWLYIEVLLF